MSYPQQPTVIVQEGRSVVLAYVLLVLLGWLGVHRMYLGKWITGITLAMLFGVGSATAAILIGWIPLIVWGLVVVWDLVTLPIQVAAFNARERNRAMMQYQRGW